MNSLTAKRLYYSDRHDERYRRAAAKHKPMLMCQWCRGSGELVTDYIHGVCITCGLCRGGGYLMPHERGLFLRWAREETRLKRLGGQP